MFRMNTVTKKLIAVIFWAAFLPSEVLADFSGSQWTLHPQFPGTNPFIIEITGTWPTDCHPGEQKPVVEYFDGHTVEIGFETIVVHITCNFRDTDYRVLLDMSQAVRDTKPQGQTIDARIRFGEGVYEQTLQLVCHQGAECENLAGQTPRPETGVYFTPVLENQGLLVARQNQSMSVFPLVYDESGSSEWLFTGNRMVEGTFFTEILRPSGGDCFGCGSVGVEPKMVPIGYLTLLVDSPDLLLVKVDDGLFAPYRRLLYGYGTFPVGPHGERTLVDIAGRWAISENRGTDPPLGDLTEFFPGAFDIALESTVEASGEPGSVGEVHYALKTLTGEILGELVCKGETGFDGLTNTCSYIDPTDAEEPLFVFRQDGPSSLSIEFARVLIAVGVAPAGKAVRVD